MALNETELEILSRLASDVGYIKGKVEDLSGPEGRVTALEKEQKDARNRQWWHSSVVLPLSLAGHAVMKHFGL